MRRVTVASGRGTTKAPGGGWQKNALRGFLQFFPRGERELLEDDFRVHILLFLRVFVLPGALRFFVGSIFFVLVLARGVSDRKEPV